MKLLNKLAFSNNQILGYERIDKYRYTKNIPYLLSVHLADKLVSTDEVEDIDEIIEALEYHGADCLTQSYFYFNVDIESRL